MIDDFLTRDNLSNFTFLMFVVVVVTEFTKRLIGEQLKGLFKKGKFKTDYIVFFYSLILSILKTLVNTESIWGSCREAFINTILIVMNALIIGYFASAGYGKIESNISESIKVKDDNTSGNALD